MFRRINGPNGAERVGPCADESSRAGCGSGRARAHERYQSAAKIIRRERCGFMAGIRPRGNVTRQAQISAKRLVAKDLAFNVESLRGSDTGTGSSIAKTKLVDAKLEMVRSGWLSQYCAVIRRFCLLSGLDRIQRNKIDQCLQRCAGPGQGTPCRHRGPWFAYHGRISGLRKHKRQRRFG